ncbi:MAG: hypothetical protein E7359_00025 [Clostridiales bacterium]|nr:hypothetical protein [Clostridiales bacterium]
MNIRVKNVFVVIAFIFLTLIVLFSIGMAFKGFRTQVFKLLNVVPDKQYNEVVNDNNKLNDVVSTLEFKKQELEKEVVDLTTQIQDLNVLIENETEENNELKNQKMTLELEKEELIKEIEKLTEEINKLKAETALYIYLEEGEREYWFSTKAGDSVNNAYIHENSNYNNSWKFSKAMLETDYLKTPCVDQTPRTLKTNIDLSSIVEYYNIKRHDLHPNNATVTWIFKDSYGNVLDMSNVENGTILIYSDMTIEDLQLDDKSTEFDIYFKHCTFVVTITDECALRLGLNVQPPKVGDLVNSYTIDYLYDVNNPALNNQSTRTFYAVREYFETTFDTLETFYYEEYSESGLVITKVDKLVLSEYNVTYKFLIDGEEVDTFAQAQRNWTFSYIVDGTNIEITIIGNKVGA